MLQDLAALGRLHTEKLDEILSTLAENRRETKPQEHHEQPQKQIVYKTDKFDFFDPVLILAVTVLAQLH